MENTRTARRFARRVVEDERCFAATLQANGKWLLTREAAVPLRWRAELASR